MSFLSNTLYNTNFNEQTTLDDLQHQIVANIGHPLQPSMFMQLADIQKRMFKNLQYLNERLDDGEVTSEEFMDEFNRHTDRAMHESLDLLGDEQFALIFSDGGLTPEGREIRENFVKEYLEEKANTPDEPRRPGKMATFLGLLLVFGLWGLLIHLLS